MSDSKYFAYDPFLQNPAGRTESPPTVTPEKHFYYGDTTTMRPPAKYKRPRKTPGNTTTVFKPLGPIPRA